MSCQSSSTRAGVIGSPRRRNFNTFRLVLGIEGWTGRGQGRRAGKGVVREFGCPHEKQWWLQGARREGLWRQATLGRSVTGPPNQLDVRNKSEGALLDD